MITAIVTALLPIIVQLIGFLIDKFVKNDQAKKAFVEFVGNLEMGGLKSVNLHKSYRDQIEAHKNKNQKEMPKIQ